MTSRSRPVRDWSAKLHAFLALTAGAIFVGLIAGHGAARTITAYENGAGSTLGYVGVIVALGTMLGKLLADSGGAQYICPDGLEPEPAP